MNNFKRSNYIIQYKVIALRKTPIFCIHFFKIKKILEISFILFFVKRGKTD